MSITGQLLVRRMLDEIDRDYADVVTLRTLGATIGRQPRTSAMCFARYSASLSTSA